MLFKQRDRVTIAPLILNTTPSAVFCVRFEFFRWQKETWVKLTSMFSAIDVVIACSLSINKSMIQSSITYCVMLPSKRTATQFKEREFKRFVYKRRDCRPDGDMLITAAIAISIATAISTNTNRSRVLRTLATTFAGDEASTIFHSRKKRHTLSRKEKVILLK